MASHMATLLAPGELSGISTMAMPLYLPTSVESQMPLHPY